MLGLLKAWWDVPRLRTELPGTTAYMRLRAGTDEDGQMAMRRWTRVTDLSPYILCAIIGAEDPGFFQHRGICWQHLAIRTYSVVFGGGRMKAVSTITQQLARNLYLHEDRSVKRKLLEMLLARRLEMVLDKARILELYINVVEWGPGTWGIENAARTYFGSAASALNPFQAVVLASLLPAPRAPLTGKNLTRALRSQHRLLHFLYGAGVMSLSEWRETSDRLWLLADELRAGRATGEVLQELGNRPYEQPAGHGYSPTATELLDSQCGLQLRIAYTALLKGETQQRNMVTRLPHRWNGRLAE